MTNSSLLLLIFKPTAFIFSIASIFTGLQSLFRPLHFSRLFGIPIVPSQTTPLLLDYISLMGSRQLSTGLATALLLLRGNDVGAGYVLMVAGVVVAGWDGVIIARNGSTRMGIVHAGPGFVIAAIAAGVVWTEG